jgi:hypothetical protein
MAALVFDVKGCSSMSEALEFACCIDLESKSKSAPFLNSYCVVLLRHYTLTRKLVVLRKSGRLDGMVGLVVEYVIACRLILLE